jgi:hypothetical protein
MRNALVIRADGKLRDARAKKPAAPTFAPPETLGLSAQEVNRESIKF